MQVVDFLAHCRSAQSSRRHKLIETWRSRRFGQRITGHARVALELGRVTEVAHKDCLSVCHDVDSVRFVLGHSFGASGKLPENSTASSGRKEHVGAWDSLAGNAIREADSTNLSPWLVLQSLKNAHLSQPCCSFNCGKFMTKLVFFWVRVSSGKHTKDTHAGSVSVSNLQGHVARQACFRCQPTSLVPR